VIGADVTGSPQIFPATLMSTAPALESAACVVTAVSSAPSAAGRKKESPYPLGGAFDGLAGPVVGPGAIAAEVIVTGAPSGR
jgi:hypothetical protein